MRRGHSDGGELLRAAFAALAVIASATACALATAPLAPTPTVRTGTSGVVSAHDQANLFAALAPAPSNLLIGEISDADDDDFSRQGDAEKAAEPAFTACEELGAERAAYPVGTDGVSAGTGLARGPPA